MKEPHQDHPSWLVWITENNIRTSFNMAPRLEITKEMRGLGWKVDLIACGPLGKQDVQGIEVLCFPREDIFLISSILFHLHITRYILRSWNQISVVLFTQMSTPWILPLRMLGIMNRRRPLFVMDTRTVPMEAASKATRKDKLRGNFLLLMNKLANWFADGQTAITRRMADLLEIPDKQLWGIFPSGVNRERFCQAASKRAWPKEDDAVVVIYVGTLNYERNLMTLCQAITEANQQGMRFKLWLYGDGNEKRALQAYAQQNGEYLQVFDAIPNERMPDILAQAHVGVLPFPDEEKYRVSSPIKLFEYMGAGMPILATRVVCHTDVIGNGDYVFWAEGSDTESLLEALKKAWQMRARLPEMGLKALAASAEWTYECSAERLDRALRHGLDLHDGQKAIHPAK